MGSRKIVEIFCDGSCLGNPGPGGWAAVIRSEGKETEISGGEKKTTNNIMELSAAIESIKTINDPSRIIVTTDSQYVVKGITEWIGSWIKKGWKTSTKKPVKNRALWEELYSLGKPHNIKWVWVRGHTGHPENERCDDLARAEAEAQR